MKFWLIFFGLSLGINSFSQNLTVEGAPVLLPRMTILERDALTPQKGMLIYNTDEDAVQAFSGLSYGSIGDLGIGMVDCLDNKYIEITPVSSGQIISIELLILGSYTASLKIMDEGLCGSPSILGITNELTTTAGFNTFVFNTPVDITEGVNIYIALNSGSLCLSHSSESNQFTIFQYSEPGPVCIPVSSGEEEQVGYVINLKVRQWVNLH